VDYSISEALKLTQKPSLNNYSQDVSRHQKHNLLLYFFQTIPNICFAVSFFICWASKHYYSTVERDRFMSQSHVFCFTSPIIKARTKSLLLALLSCYHCLTCYSSMRYTRDILWYTYSLHIMVYILWYTHYLYILYFTYSLHTLYILCYCTSIALLSIVSSGYSNNQNLTYRMKWSIWSKNWPKSQSLKQSSSF